MFPVFFVVVIVVIVKLVIVLCIAVVTSVALRIGGLVQEKVTHQRPTDIQKRVLRMIKLNCVFSGLKSQCRIIERKIIRRQMTKYNCFSFKTIYYTMVKLWHFCNVKKRSIL